MSSWGTKTAWPLLLIHPGRSHTYISNICISPRSSTVFLSLENYISCTYMNCIGLCIQYYSWSTQEAHTRTSRCLQLAPASILPRFFVHFLQTSVLLSLIGCFGISIPFLILHDTSRYRSKVKTRSQRSFDHWTGNAVYPFNHYQDLSLCCILNTKLRNQRIRVTVRIQCYVAKNVQDRSFVTELDP